MKNEYYILKNYFLLQEYKRSPIPRKKILEEFNRTISKYRIDEFLKVSVKEKFLEEVVYKQGVGRPIKAYVLTQRNENGNDLQCSFCLFSNYGIYCTICGKKVCNHNAHFEYGYVFCPICYANIKFCPDCIKRTYINNYKTQMAEKYGTIPIFQFPSEQTESILFRTENNFYCLKEGCKYNKDPIPDYDLERIWRGIKNEIYFFVNNYDPIDEYEERKMYEDLEATKSELLAKQGILLNECECDDNGDCALRVFTAPKIVCPKGLPGFNPSCAICQECEYYDEFTSLSPYDEEYQDFDCKFFGRFDDDEIEDDGDDNDEDDKEEYED